MTAALGRTLAALVALVAAGSIGCTRPAPGPNEHRDSASPPEKEDPMSWSSEVGGLQVAVELPPGPLAATQPVTATLHFRNRSNQPLRVYLIESEPFRGFQSSFRLRDEASGQVVSRPPELHPHGYVVTERDFHLIEPGGEARFPQALGLTGAGHPGRYTVEYRYENRVESWPGGVETLDGPTQPLFGGGRIPNIWLGEVTAKARVEVTR